MAVIQCVCVCVCVCVTSGMGLTGRGRGRGVCGGGEMAGSAKFSEAETSAAAANELVPGADPMAPGKYCAVSLQKNCFKRAVVSLPLCGLGINRA